MQRAKRALKAQLQLRGEAARRAQKLRVDRELAGVALGTGNGGEDEVEGEGEESRNRGEEIEELEGSVAAASKVRGEAARCNGSFLLVCPLIRTTMAIGPWSFLFDYAGIEQSALV